MKQKFPCFLVDIQFEISIIEANFADPSIFFKYLNGSTAKSCAESRVKFLSSDDHSELRIKRLDSVKMQMQNVLPQLMLCDTYSKRIITSKEFEEIKKKHVVNMDVFKDLINEYGSMLPISFNIGGNNFDLYKPSDSHSSDLYYLKYIKNNGHIQIQYLIHPYHYKQLLKEYVWHQRIHEPTNSFLLPSNVKILRRNDYIGLTQARQAVQFLDNAIVLWEDVAAFFPNFYIHAISWIALRDRVAAFQFRDEKELWQNAMEFAFKNAQGKRTVSVPIGEKLVDVLMHGYMSYIIADLSERVLDFFKGIHKDPKSIFSIVCRSDNIEIYLDQSAFKGKITQIVHRIQVICTDTFAMYGLSLNHRKRKQVDYVVDGLDMLMKRKDQWISEKGKLDFAVKMINKRQLKSIQIAISCTSIY